MVSKSTMEARAGFCHELQTLRTDPGSIPTPPPPPPSSQVALSGALVSVSVLARWHFSLGTCFPVGLPLWNPAKFLSQSRPSEPRCQARVLKPGLGIARGSGQRESHRDPGPCP